MDAIGDAGRVLAQVARFKAQLVGGGAVIQVDRQALLKLLSEAERMIGDLVDHAGHLKRQHTEEMLRLRHRQD